jgi:hypothetical protein
MERRRGTTLAIVAALVVAVVSLGVAFAAFSTTLNITGSATVQSSSWDIHYSTGSGGTAPSSDGTSVSPTASNTQSGITSTASGTGSLKPATFTWSGTFKTPGDRLVYTFYVCNKGSYNAKLTSITTPSASCKIGNTAETTACPTYKIYKNDGLSSELQANETLNAGICKQIWVVATLPSTLTAAQLPSAEVTVTPVTINMAWGQV